MDSLFTRAEAAAVLKKKISWLRWAERRRLIPFVKVGQQIRYMQKDLKAWIDGRRIPASPTARRRAR